MTNLDHSLEERVAALEVLRGVDVQRLRLEPGDIVALRFKQELDQDERDSVRQQWKERLGERADLFPLFILDAGTSISVLSARAAH